MMQLNLRQLEYFVAAMQHGGAARGAQALHVSQPSVSKAISDLEALWGERLFVRRHARGLDPTPAGTERYREALALLERAQVLSQRRNATLSGTLTMGCLATLAPRYLPAILRLFRERHPQITVRLEEGDTETLTRAVERGALDLALMYDLGLARGVHLAHVADLWPYVLMPWGHRLAARQAIGIAELAREPLVLINLPHSREYFLSLFRSAGQTPAVAAEAGSIEMVRAMVANGWGVSLLTTRPVRDYVYDGQRIACRRLRGPHAPQPVVLASPLGDATVGQPLREAMTHTVRTYFESQAEEDRRSTRRAAQHRRRQSPSTMATLRSIQPP